MIPSLPFNVPETSSVCRKNRNKLFMCIDASQLLHNFQIVRELTTFLKLTKVSKIQLAVC